jgi:hypothetical protein
MDSILPPHGWFRAGIYWWVAGCCVIIALRSFRELIRTNGDSRELSLLLITKLMVFGIGALTCALDAMNWQPARDIFAMIQAVAITGFVLHSEGAFIRIRAQRKEMLRIAQKIKDQSE